MYNNGTLYAQYLIKWTFKTKFMKIFTKVVSVKIAQPFHFNIPIYYGE